MIISEEERKEFEEAARPLIKFLNEHCDPHAVVIVDAMHANLHNGVCGFVTEDYIED